MPRIHRSDVNKLMMYFQSEWVHFELRMLDDYIRDQEDQFEKQLANAQERYHEFEKDIAAGNVEGPAGYHDHIRDSIFEEMWKIDSNYIQFFRQSQIIQLYSFLEYKLRFACDTFAKIKKTVYTVRDLNGSSDMDKTKKFMVKSMGIDLRHLEPEWSFFQNLRKLRNIIVHHNAEFSDKDNDYPALNSFQKGRFELQERKFKKSNDTRPKWFEIKLTEKSFLPEITSKMETLLVNIGKQEVK